VTSGDAAAAPHRGGRGAGVFSVWLAEQGMEVTGIDLFPEAIAMAQARAQTRGVRAEFIAGDLFASTPERPFDLVYDSGCLHAVVGGDVDAYKKQLLRWLAKDGDYVLAHWGKRHAFDWRPIGPRRRSEQTIRRLFTPELQLRETEVADFETPRPFGPVVRGVASWFRRNGV
jgi:cyclopropane fatty-acyl-phospholipid synthase-like methyltransferase